LSKQEDTTEVSGYRRYFPLKHELKKNNNYNFYISNDESIIYKKNNHSNPLIEESLESEVKRSFFSQLLAGNALSESLQFHVVKGFDLEADGSYKSEFIHGFRLDLLHTYDLSQEQVRSILEACEQFIEIITDIDSHGKLTGDWALHNLVYSFKYDRIVNIDLEGFLFYDPMPEWANCDYIVRWVHATIQKNLRD
jgi:hypothetical protein